MAISAGCVPGREVWSVGALASLFLMIVQAMVAPIPAVLITGANGLLFGPLLGGLLSIVSATLAAAVCFLLARSFGAPFVSRLVPSTVLNGRTH